MPYYDNFWHKDMHENVQPPACMIFILKVETEDQAIDQWWVCLNACFNAKGKHSEHMLCFVLQLSIICYETYNTVYCFTTFKQ